MRYDSPPATMPAASALLASRSPCTLSSIVPDEIILQRLTARVSCKNCKAIYNKLFMPPKKEGVCDACGGELIQRADDSLETAKGRLKVFYDQTSPLIDLYQKRGLIFEITELDLAKASKQLLAELEA